MGLISALTHTKSPRIVSAVYIKWAVVDTQCVGVGA